MLSPPLFFTLNGRIFCDLADEKSKFFGPAAPSGTAGEYFYQIYDDKIILTASIFIFRRFHIFQQKLRDGADQRYSTSSLP